MKTQEKLDSDDRKQQRQQRSAVIAAQVLEGLGQPAGPHRVDIRPLWENRYRVNILVGADAGCSRVAHSYFLETDAEARILASTPKITREY